MKEGMCEGRDEVAGRGKRRAKRSLSLFALT